jgi:hypothetical protein
MKYALLFFSLIFFVSCDCMYDVRGTVVDERGEPLDSVVSYMEGRTPDHFNRQTDSAGKFEVNEITGFNCRCKDVIFVRRGYDTLSVPIKNMDTVVVKMKKL